MDARTRYLKCLLFEETDKVPLLPGKPRESTLAAWHGQGLAEGVNYLDVTLEALGIDTQARIEPELLDVSFTMMPQFEEKILEHKDGHYIVQDWMGAITEISDTYDYTYIRAAKDFVTRKWHKFPVENRDDWQEMKKRFDPATPGRCPEGISVRVAKLTEASIAAGVHFNGPFWQLREWLGFESLCILFIEDPDFVAEMIDSWTAFVSDVLARVFDLFTPDRLFISEDMAYKGHAMISPEMTRRFLQPSYERWVRQARAAGCPIVDMDSDGFVGELIPIWIDAGINVSDPVEVAAGNDIIEFRDTFGRRMAYTGGIDKRAMAKGGQTMRDEVRRVAKVIDTGGYIPGCDHGVPHDVSWPNWLDYVRALAEVTGWL